MSKLALVLAVAALFLAGCGEGAESSEDSRRHGAVARQARLRRAAVHQAKMRQRARAATRHRREVIAARRHRMQVRAAEAQRRAAAKAEAEELAAEEAAAEEASTAEEAGECDPNYSGACLDPYASDYDCEGGSGDGPEYTGTVTVVGEDHYGLDADSDGTGCESY